jgi:CRISPR system Cascade subunit CasA
MTGNLLLEPLLSVRAPDGETRRTTLPGLLAAMHRDEVAGFPALRPHQAHPWHAFLVQLAAMALEGQPVPPPTPGKAMLPCEPTEDAWLEKLRALTPDFPGDEPWTLAVEDLSKPAFFQPPIPEASLSVLRRVDLYPDELDVLFTGKNLGVKTGELHHSKEEHWVYSLVILQTSSGYTKAGPALFYHGTVRRNGTIATRAEVGLLSRQTPGGHWRRDVSVLLHHPEHYKERGLPFSRNGHGLLWLLPWDGTTSLDVKTLHPLFLEICRRVRLVDGEDGLHARMVGTKVQRVQAKDLKGNLADPWIPIRAKDGAAFNSRPTYRIAQAVLFPQDSGVRVYVPALLQQRHPEDDGRPLAVRFRMLVRGQGKTEGYEERLITIPREAERFVFGDAAPDAGRLAQGMVETASAAQYRVLKPALLRFMQAGREQIEFRQPETSAWADAWIDRLDTDVDQRFFPVLWQCGRLLESGDETAALDPWREALNALCREYFQQAVQSLPLPHAVRPRALAKAEGMLYGALRKHLNPVREAEGV